jgi:hypothetical protein
MTDPFRDDLLEAFERLRGWIKTGLRRVMEIPRKQPHYAAALLIVIGCEALGRLLLGRHPKPAIGRHLKTGHRE